MPPPENQPLLKINAIVCAARPHGEAAVVARLFTADQGLIATYIAGGRGRLLRPVLIPGNAVVAEISTHGASHLPFARLELAASRGPWLGEPLAAAAIGWATTLTVTACPERHAYPPLFDALSALLTAICHAPSARRWLPGMLAYERLLLREVGYGALREDPAAPLEARFAAHGRALTGHLAPASNVARGGADVMAARARLGSLLARIEGGD